LQIVGIALQYVAVTNGVLLVGKMINGVAVGGLLSVGTTYASEVRKVSTRNTNFINFSKIAPPRLRGIVLGGFAFFGVAMQCVALGIIRSLVPNLRPVAFRIAFGLQWLVGGIPIITFFFSPE
jgi:hypothetical protein